MSKWPDTYNSGGPGADVLIVITLILSLTGLWL